MEVIISSGPKAPDPYATSAAQTQSNQQTAAYNAALNRVDQYSPYGSSTYTVVNDGSSKGSYDPLTGAYTPGTQGAPQYRQDITLTPMAQQQLDNELKQNNTLSELGFGLADKAGDSLKGSVDTSKLPALSGGQNVGGMQSQLNFGGAPGLYGVGDFQQSARDTANAQYSQYASRLDPQWQNSDHDLESKLANQGIVQGSEAYTRAQDQQSRNKNDAYAQAQYNSVNAGNQERARMFADSLAGRQQATGEIAAQGAFANQAQQQAYQQSMAGAQQNNSARAQGLQEQSTLQSLPLNQLNALRSGTQINNPQFGQVPQATAANTDVSGNVYKAYELNSANSNNFMNGLMGLGASAITKYSDRRVKRDIVALGQVTKMGLPLYVYSYLGSTIRKVGVIAQDVMKVMPEAVLFDEHGFMRVNYEALA